MKKENNIIDAWLDEHGDPEIDLFIDKNIAIVDKVIRYLKENKISKQAFAEMMDKRPSEVSKWLGGMHNLTLKSIVKMEYALGIDLIHTEPVKEKELKYVYLGKISCGEEYIEKKCEYEETYSIAM